MKLYECQTNDIVELLEKPTIPIDSNKPDEIIIFKHIDGMYSYCMNRDKTVVHVAAWTEVAVVGKYEP